MKIYLGFSAHGDENYFDRMKSLAQTIEDLGHNVFTKWDLKELG